MEDDEDLEEEFILLAKDLNDKIIAKSDIVSVLFDDADLLFWINMHFNAIHLNKNRELTANDWMSLRNEKDIENLRVMIY